jgi:hypothetical protein
MLIKRLGTIRWRRALLLVVLPLLFVSGTTVGYLSYTGTSVSELSVLGPGSSAVSNAKVSLQVNVNHQEQHSVDLLWLIQMAFKGQFWRPSCLLFCGKGISYYLDPSPIITNEGRDIEQCKIFGVAGTITCSFVGTDVPTVIYLSTSANSASASDMQSGISGPCYSGVTGLITSGGLADVAGTLTAGVAGTTVTTTISHQFTAGETDSSVQYSCLKTETDSGSHIYLYAEGSFGPDSLISGNTITITWTIGRS